MNDDCEKAVSYFYKNNISFDAIITDPPYNISKENNFNTMKSSKRQGVDFGEWDKEFDYLSWIKKYAPLVKEDGSMIIFCSYLYISFIIKELEENDFIVKDILRWVKSNPMPRNINRRYVQDCELAIWAVRKNAKWTFNNNSKTYLRAEFNTSIVSGKEKTSHPTQKSLKLMQEIIKIHTNENDIILDPFMGSATTGIACKRLKRKFYGIESSKDYFEICKKRFENEF
ncbi:DNA-methyltransferase [Campylobacter canadensis]|uniref:DNA-methyltransferase n=1 Tax=Campylobacter canadensis TaxID=449520 RepID=UPI001CCAE65C|nr:site-specific DNA-methyltransferase [Campylobacter canadensis]